MNDVTEKDVTSIVEALLQIGDNVELREAYIKTLGDEFSPEDIARAQEAISEPEVEPTAELIS